MRTPISSRKKRRLFSPRRYSQGRANPTGPGGSGSLTYASSIQRGKRLNDRALLKSMVENEIYRCQAVSEYESNGGAVVMLNSKGSGPSSEIMYPGFAPIYMWDVTQIPNGSDTSTLNMYSARIRQNIDGIQFRNEYVAGSPHVAAGTPGDQTVAYLKPETVSSISNINHNPKKKSLLKWLDFRAMFYGVTKRATRWSIDLVRFRFDDAAPNSGGTSDFIVDKKVTGIYRELLHKYMSNPIIPATGHSKENFQVLYSKHFTIDETTSIQESVNRQQFKLFYHMNKIVDYGWKDTVSNNAADGISPTGGAELTMENLDIPHSYARDNNPQQQTRPTSRIFLIVRALAPYQLPFETDPVADSGIGAGFQTMDDGVIGDGIKRITNADTVAANVGLTTGWQADFPSFDFVLRVCHAKPI